MNLGKLIGSNPFIVHKNLRVGKRKCDKERYEKNKNMILIVFNMQKSCESLSHDQVFSVNEDKSCELCQFLINQFQNIPVSFFICSA